MLFTGASGVVVSLATDGEFVYFDQAYDSPNGSIRRVAKDAVGGPAQDLVTGLGAPVALALHEAEVCWRELEHGLIGCAPKEGGQARQLASDQSFISLYCSALAIDSERAFLITQKDIRKIALSGGQIDVVARAGDYCISSAVVLDDANVYFSDGSHLKKLDKNNVVNSE